MGYASPNSPYGTPPAVYQSQMFMSRPDAAAWPSSYYSPQSPSIAGTRQFHPGMAPGHSQAYMQTMPSSQSQRPGQPGGARSARQHARFVLVEIPDDSTEPLPFRSAAGMVYNTQPVYLPSDMPSVPSHHAPYQQYVMPPAAQFVDPQLSFSGDSSNSFSNHPSPRHTSPYIPDRAVDWYPQWPGGVPGVSPNLPYGSGPIMHSGTIAPVRMPLSQPPSVPFQAMAQSGSQAVGPSDLTRRDDESKLNESTA